MIRTVSPAPAIDRTYVLAELVPGAVNRASSVSAEASGKGVNVSRALSMAGMETVAVFPAGGSTGAELVALLDADGVAHHAVPTAAETRTNITAVLPGATTKLNAPAAALTSEELDELLDASVTGLSSQDWVLLAGALPAAAEGFVARLTERVHAVGARVCVDSSGAALHEAVAARVDLLAPNADELAELAPGHVGTDLVGWVAAAARRLATRTGGAVLVSLGPDGAVWTDAQHAWHAFGQPISPVNTAGAGDALLAGVLSDASGDIPDRLRTAIGWATENCLAATTVTRPPAPGTYEVAVEPVEI